MVFGPNGASDSYCYKGGSGSEQNNTSSTAQGGGGSFKKRKPIGEIGCCESDMAGQSHCWTERRLISLTLVYLSMRLSIYLSIFGVVSFSVM